jgi:hypothetical protein
MRHNPLNFLRSRPFPRNNQPRGLCCKAHKRKAFRITAILRPMYPPHVTDRDIKLLIRELTVGDRLPSGASLRAALKQRFASRGGVARIYRLLADARATSTPKPNLPEVERLEREVQSLREATKLAQHREETHQTRWALEVDRLRQQLAALEPLALKAKAALDSAELLRRQLHASHVRIAALEQQLIERGPREGEGS